MGPIPPRERRLTPKAAPQPLSSDPRQRDNCRDRLVGCRCETSSTISSRRRRVPGQRETGHRRPGWRPNDHHAATLRLLLNGLIATVAIATDHAPASR